MGGDEQVAQRRAGAFQAQGGFVGQRRAETVAEQRQGRVGEIAQGEGGAVGEVLQAGSRRLVEAVLAARVLQGKQVDVWWQAFAPATEEAGAAACMGKQARRRRGIGVRRNGRTQAALMRGPPARGAGARAGPSC